MFKIELGGRLNKSTEADKILQLFQKSQPAVCLPHPEARVVADSKYAGDIIIRTFILFLASRRNP